MKRKLVVAFIATLILALFASPAFAFTSVSGLVHDKNGDGWTEGGTVSVFATDTGAAVACGSDTLDGSGNYSITFTCTPDAFTTIFILVQPTAGANGDPSDQTIQITQLPIAGDSVQNVNLGTGPLAVSLSGAGTSSNMNMQIAAAFAALLVAASAFVVVRRNSAVNA